MPDIIHSSTLPFESKGFKHRVNAPSFKYLFTGSPSSPNNYLFFLGLQRDFFSPVHKHNFEQIRYAHKGDFSISPTLTIQPGEVCYHPEGVEYGPQTDPDDGQERVLLLLQFGGVSGQGFLGYDQLLKVQRDMMDSGKGQFDGGKFFASGARERGEKGKDGFEAVWEECNSRRLIYPEPRYETPVLMKPQSFGWRKHGEKVWRKHLGSFTERETRVEIVRLEIGGVWNIEAEEAVQFGFVVAGEGFLNAAKVEFEDAIRLQAGEWATLKSESRLEILRIVVRTLVEEEV